MEAACFPSPHALEYVRRLKMRRAMTNYISLAMLNPTVPYLWNNYQHTYLTKPIIQYYT